MVRSLADRTFQLRSSCADSSYPRSYSQDKYFVNGGAYRTVARLPLTSSDWTTVKRELYTSGSLLLLYEASREHMGYVSIDVFLTQGGKLQRTPPTFRLVTMFSLVR